MKNFLVISLLLICACVASGQTNQSGSADNTRCLLTVGKDPDVVGLRLGMTAAQALALFPGSSEDSKVRAGLAFPANSLGVSSLSLFPERYTSKEKFPGIDHITLTFLDGRISTVYVGFKGPEWKHVDEFITAFFAGKNFPSADAWETVVGMDTQSKTLRCSGFEVTVFAGGQDGSLNSVKLRDTVAEQTVKDRREAAKQKSTQGSKP